MDFKDKVVIVTGSSSGIGAVTARYFANLSAKVVLTARSEAKLKEVAKEVEDAKGIKPLVVKADVTNDEDVKRIIEETIQKFGQIDVVINNAGEGIRAKLLDGIEHFDRMIAINLRSVYLLTSLAVPYLIKTKGNIVNISSVAGVRPAAPERLAYCVAKAGLDMFTKCIAKELAVHGIRVNSVNPGAVKTNFLPALGMTKEDKEIFIKGREIRSPLGKITSSEDVAELIIFLASNKANSITGGIHVIENGDLLL